MKRAAILLAVLVVACGCGGGKKDDPATLAIRDQAAEVKLASADWKKGIDGQDLVLGEAVKTNGTGFAQIDFPDGSLARLDSDAHFVLHELKNAGGAQQVTGALDGGRVWSRVEKVSGSGHYEIDTAGANATVRGTQFDVDCRASDGSCTFSVADGTVEVRTTKGRKIVLHAGDSVTVAKDGTVVEGMPKSTLAALRDDPWVGQNLGLDRGDESKGKASAGIHGSALAGTYDVTRTVTDSNGRAPLGQVDHYTLVLSCKGTPCALDADVWPNAQLVGDRVVAIAELDEACPDGSGTGTATTRSVITMRITAISDGPDGPVVTKLEGDQTLSTHDIPSTCNSQNDPVANSLVAVRTGGGAPTSHPTAIGSG